MPVEEQQVSAAVSALFAYFKQRGESTDTASEGKQLQLFEEEDDIFVTITLKRVPDKGRTKPFRIPLKHSLYGRDGKEVCLFTKDPQRQYKDMLAETPVKNVTRVIGVSKLREKFHQYKSKRELLSSYDLFLADERILPLLPAMLGTKFFQRNRQPAPVNLTRPSWAKELAGARDSTYMVLGGGSCSAVRVGTSAFTRKEVVANVMVVVDAMVQHVPRKWKNVQAVHIKAARSAALPVYNALPSQLSPDESKVEAPAQARKSAKRKKPSPQPTPEESKPPQPESVTPAPARKKARKNKDTGVGAAATARKPPRAPSSARSSTPAAVKSSTQRSKRRKANDGLPRHTGEDSQSSTGVAAGSQKQTKKAKAATPAPKKKSKQGSKGTRKEPQTDSKAQAARSRTSAKSAKKRKRKAAE